jgi:hypothetical protein
VTFSDACRRLDLLARIVYCREALACGSVVELAALLEHLEDDVAAELARPDVDEGVAA